MTFDDVEGPLPDDAANGGGGTACGLKVGMVGYRGGGGFAINRVGFASYTVL
jgi:hypothetical protein